MLAAFVLAGFEVAPTSSVNYFLLLFFSFFACHVLFVPFHKNKLRLLYLFAFGSVRSNSDLGVTWTNRRGPAVYGQDPGEKCRRQAGQIPHHFLPQPRG